MIDRADLGGLSAPRKAELIYGQARSELSDRLWRAALGNGDDAGAGRSAGGGRDGLSFDALLAMLDVPDARPSIAESRPRVAPPPVADEVASESVAMPISGAPFRAGPTSVADIARAAPAIEGGLGPNARHLPALAAAATRTGIPMPALAAIVHAEAAKGRDGAWQTFSRNPRSSAAGLGQFLSGTWEGMAETKGTWLNQIAATRGWLDGAGRTLSGARSALLQLRYDPAASIQTTADYARENLDGLARAGVSIGAGAATIAKSAYLGHHLGLGDAIRFMKTGLDPSRARALLGAQIGAAKAGRHIAEAGGATAAHRAWFLDFLDRNIRPERFTV